MRATLEVVREDGDNLLYWNGRKMLVARAIRDDVSKLRAPCSVEAEIGDMGGAPTVVRLHAVRESKARPAPAPAPEEMKTIVMPGLSTEDHLRGARFDRALTLLDEQHGPEIEREPSLLSQRLRAHVQAGDADRANADLVKILAFAESGRLTPREVAEVLQRMFVHPTERSEPIARALVVELSRWLRAGGLPVATSLAPIGLGHWPIEDLLDQLGSEPPVHLVYWLERARREAPSDPRFLAAEARLREWEVERDRRALDELDQNEFRRLHEVLDGLEKRFGIRLPKRLREVWLTIEYPRENLAHQQRAALERIAPGQLVRPGARGTPIAELAKIAERIATEHFAEDPQPAFLPIARDSEDAWIGLWLVAHATLADYAVLRVTKEGVTLVAQTTEEWLA